MSARAVWLLALVVSGLALQGPAQAGDPGRGQEKSLTCQACHGPDGNSPTGLFPNIAGQHEDYLLRSMQGYKTGERTNAIMKAIVEPLSETDLEDLAAYYARQKGLYPINAGVGTGIP